MKAEIRVYVGRWDMLPLAWEGVNGLELADKKEIKRELAREIEEYDDTHPTTDNRMGVYTLEEFEAEFNYDTKSQFTTDTYWIKFF